MPPTSGQLRHLLRAAFGRIGAAGVEAAAFRRLQWAWDLAFQDDLLLFCGGYPERGWPTATPWCRGCSGFVKRSSLFAISTILAQIHNRDLIADVLHDAQVVGDKEVGQIHLFLQILEQVEHLGADRNVQRPKPARRRRPISGFVDQGPGDDDSLTLAAGKFVRIFVQVFFTQTDNIQHLDDPARGVPPWGCRARGPAAPPPTA